LIRFGVFEADLETGELRKCGVRVKLQPVIHPQLLTSAGELPNDKEDISN
jgi:hypothetical protein